MGFSRKTRFQTNEVSLSPDGEGSGRKALIFIFNKGNYLYNDKNIISFSISDDARNIIFKDEIKLQYEIDTGSAGIWREAANKLRPK